LLPTGDKEFVARNT